LGAAWLRVYRLDNVPPGWRDDEVVETTVHAALIQQGHWVLFFPQAEGHEPLYHYLSAAWITLAGSSLFIVRLLSAFLGLLSVAALYRLARSLFGAPVALVAAAALAASFWSLMYSRFKLRQVGMLAPMLLAFYFFFRVLRPRGGLRAQRRDAALAALWLSASLYTYYAARALPAILLALALYLFVFHRAALRGAWRPLALGAGATLLLVAPLAVAIALTPQAQARLSVVGAPLAGLLRGDPGYALRNTAQTLAMPAFTGDPEYLYNIPGRPVFGPLGAALFALGLMLAAWRWRQPRYAFLLLWLVGGLAPAFVSTPAASLGHTIAAQPAFYLLPAVAVIELGGWVSRMLSRSQRTDKIEEGRTGGLVDLSPRPPLLPFAPLRGSATLREAGRKADSGDSGPSVASGPGGGLPDQRQSVRQSVRRRLGSPFPLREGGRGDRSTSLPGVPSTPMRGMAGVRERASYFTTPLLALIFIIALYAHDLPDYFVVWPALPMVRQLYRADLHEAAAALRRLPPHSDLGLASLTLHPADALALALDTPGLDLRPRVFTPGRAWPFPDQSRPVLLLSAAGSPGLGLPPAAGDFELRLSGLPAQDQPGVPLQVYFQNGWQCYGYTLRLGPAGSGQALTLVTYWRVGPGYVPPAPRPVDVLSGTPLPFKFFSHLLRPDGSLLAGDDRLDLDPATLRPGDSFAQVFVIALPASLARASYPVQVGLYDSASGARVPLASGGDGLILQSLQLPQ